MLRVDVGELFPISVALVDETVGTLRPGQTVLYEIRDINDGFLSPPISGTLVESAVEGGIYNTTESINTAGRYVIYATCSGFVSNAEEVLVNEESIYDVTKMNRNYNVSVEDVVRTSATPSASQTVRNVPLNKTDYLITVMKNDDDSDWSSATVSGVVYAWYRSVSDDLPYKMGAKF